ncbi:MAG TPA: UBP-type zinc finger domain-containing protein [Solirubrobacteraceae bacterium]
MATRSSASEARLPLAGSGCSHLERLDQPTTAAAAEACQECGATKVLRVCLTCGHVGCCDSHRGHATAHARASGHPLIRAWKGGAFVYCYEHGYL